eukprot:10321546-Lingulodinium_polyedra.AAC.1
MKPAPIHRTWMPGCARRSGVHGTRANALAAANVQNTCYFVTTRAKRLDAGARTRTMAAWLPTQRLGARER